MNICQVKCVVATIATKTYIAIIATDTFTIWRAYGPVIFTSKGVGVADLWRVLGSNLKQSAALATGTARTPYHHRSYSMQRDGADGFNLGEAAHDRLGDVGDQGVDVL